MSELKSYSGILIKRALCLCSFLLLSACSTEDLNLNLFAGKKISGTVEPFIETSLGSKVSRQTSCTNVTVDLYQINADGTEVLPPIQTTQVSADGEYTFKNVDEINVFSQTVDGAYKVTASGCGEVYSRFVTGRESQVISFGSSLLAFSMNSDKKARVKSAIVDTQGKKIQELISLLETHSSYDSAYAFLQTDDRAKTLFQELFGSPETILVEAAPLSRPEGLPEALNENETYTFSANSHHWNTSYDLVYEWRRGGALLSTSPSFSYTPGANDQNNEVTFTLYIGQNDGSGEVDLSKPYKSYEYKREIKNTVPPQVPAISLASSSNTSNTTVYIQMNTGVLLANCESFSDLAFTENTTPPSQADFDNQNLSCQQSGTQILTHALTDTSDGTKVIRLWSRDASGQVSQHSRFVSMTLNSSAPVLGFTSPAADTVGSSGLTIMGTCDDSFSVDIGGSGLSTDLTTICSGGNFSQAITFSGGEGTKTITLSQTDLASNTTTVSRDFLKDSVAPVVSLSSPAAGTIAQNGVTLTGNCEDGLTVDLSGSGLSSPSVATCSAGSFSQAIVFSAGDGSKTITVSQTDAAENTDSVSRNFIRDTTAPTLTFATPAANTPAQTGVTITGSCEDGLTVNLSGSGLSSPSTTSCSGGNFSQAISFSAGDGTKTIALSQTDAAGNTDTTSRDFVKDTTAPSLSFTSPALATEAQSGVTIEGSCEAGLTIHLSGSGLSSPSTTSCSGGNFSQAINFSAGEGTKTIEISQTDAAGNMGSASRDFIRDSTAPAIAFSTPAANTSAQTGVTLTGSCEDGLGVSLSGSGLSSPTTATCSFGAFSEAISFTAGEGAKTITVSQTDSAGNIGTASRDFIRDNTDPNITIASPAAGYQTQSSLTLAGSCETGLDITYSGDILSSFTNSCSGGSYSQAIFLSSGDGAKTVTVSQTDAAGNTASVSRGFVKDTQAPVMTQTSLTFPHYSNTDTVTFGGACESGYDVEIEYSGSSVGSATCNGAWSFALPSQTTDATRDYTFKQTDAAGNQVTTLGRWIRDTIPPTLSFTSSPSPITATDSVSFSGNCESGLPNPIAVSGTDTTTVSCSSGTWTYTVATQTSDGTRAYRFTLSDRASNQTQIDGSWQRNTQVPALQVTSASRVANGLDQATFSGDCESGVDIEIRRDGTLENTVACSGTFSYNVASQTTDASRTYEFKQTNAASLSTSESVTWIRDKQGPAFSLNQMLLNNGSSNTSLARIAVDAQAVDSLTPVTHLCFKTEDTTPPPSADSCFVSVEDPAIGLTPALTISLDDYGYNLPITPGVYSIYAWAKDEVGNVSALTTSGAGTDAQDKASITYTLPIPPQVSRVSASSGDAPADPLSEADLTVGVGQPIYVKWKASDDTSLPADGISVYFTTDDNTYTLVSSGLTNGQNGSCTVDNALTPADDDMTGCYYWASAPVSGYLKVRVIAKDADGLEAGMTATPLNIAGKIRFLAGNTDLGTNLSARAAMFLYRKIELLDISDPQTLVVSRDGTVYFKDAVRGILKVSPSDGVQRVFLKQTGSSTGDDGPVSAATAKDIFKIALDHNQPVQRLWVFDYDRIRRINLETGVIETIIGGGGDSGDTVVGATNLKMTAYASGQEEWYARTPFFALPDGDLYFQSGNDGYVDRIVIGAGYRIRRYNASTDTVTSFYITELSSTTTLTAADLGDCRSRGMGFSFDPTNSQILKRILLLRTHQYWPACNDKGDTTDYVSLDENGVGHSVHPPKLTPNSNDQKMSFVTGLDGKLYAFNKSWVKNGLYRYEEDTNTWTQLIGNSANKNGQCEDGSAALECPTYLADVFVQEDGTIYFLDNGRVRTLTSTNTVVSLMGQGIVEADEVPAKAARLGSDIKYFHLRNNGGIVFPSASENNFYEFEPNGQSFLIAGNGALGGASLGVDSDTVSINLENPERSGDRFGMDPVTGDIFHHAGNHFIRRLVRNSSDIGSAGQWQNFIGGGSVHWTDPAAEGSSDISFTLDCSGFGHDSDLLYDPSCWHYPIVLGVFGGNVVMHKSELSRHISTGNQAPRNSSLKAYSLSTKTQTHLIGMTGESSHNTVCSDGTPAASCEFISSSQYRMTPVQFDSVDGKYFFAKNNSSQLYYFNPSGSLQSSYMAHGIRSFAYRRIGTDEYIYYCSNTTGAIRRWHLNTDTEVALDWPVSSMKCHTGAMHWSWVRDSLIFHYNQNGLMGFAEYLDPSP